MEIFVTKKINNIQSTLQGILDKIADNYIDAWEHDLESTTEAVAIQDHKGQEDEEPIIYNNWLQDLNNLNEQLKQDKVTAYPRKCDVTGKGFSKGFCFEDGELYIEKEEHALQKVKQEGFNSLQEAYDNDFCYYTEWYDDTINIDGVAYDRQGNEYRRVDFQWILFKETSIVFQDED